MSIDVVKVMRTRVVRLLSALQAQEWANRVSVECARYLHAQALDRCTSTPSSTLDISIKVSSVDIVTHADRHVEACGRNPGRSG